jgi:hypothetical protein
MANSFMIRFPLDGRQCYANVHVYEGHPREFTVHIIHPQLNISIPRTIEFVREGGEFRLAGHQALPSRVVEIIAAELKKHTSQA